MLRLSLILPLVLLGTAALDPSTAAAGPPDPQAVDGAIERGVAWLGGEQNGIGTWGPSGEPLGHTALVAFALLHCGVAEDDATPAGRRLARAFRHLDRHGPGRAGSRSKAAGTYAVSLLLLTLRARGREEDRVRIQALTDLLVRTQALNGQWWYQHKNLKLSKHGDNSNTQFALLALGAAHGEGYTVPRETFERALTWWTQSHHRDGGFGYCSGGSKHSACTGSMTAAGIACLAICRTVLGGGQTKAEKKAVEYLAKVFSVTRNHGPPQGKAGQRQRNSGRGWLHYYLWTVERAMVLAERPLLGRHDWFSVGAARLLETQKKDGSWRQEHPLYGTCFALLFLTRAADPPRAFTPREKPRATRPKAPVTPQPAPAAPDAAPHQGEGPAPAPPEGSVTDWLKEALGPGVLIERCRRTGAASLRPLVRALRSRDRKTRQRAFEALHALLPDERTQRVDRHPLPRGRLDFWLRRNAHHLVLKDGRFVLP